MKKGPSYKQSGSGYKPADKNPGKVNTRIIVAVVIGFVVGFGSAWLWLNRPTSSSGLVGGTERQAADEERKKNEESEDSKGVFVEENLVLVKDQSAGNEVFISRVELKTPGWVAIHEDISGEPGRILGAARFDSGVYQGTVELLRNTESGSIYYASLRGDNGDKEFDIKTDLALTDELGEVVFMQFEAY